MIAVFNILGTDEGNEERKKDVLNYWSDVIYEPCAERKERKSESKYIIGQTSLWTPLSTNKYDADMVCEKERENWNI